VSEWRFLLGFFFFITFFLSIVWLGGPSLLYSETGIEPPKCNLTGSWTDAFALLGCAGAYLAYIFSLASVSSSAKFLSVVLTILIAVLVYIIIKLIVEVIKAIGSVLPFT